jgi:broad specificity phosphatase PhoE
VERLFERPDELIFGRETAHEAHERFAGAVERTLERFPEGNLAIVTHGTVLTLFVARATGIEPASFWKRLGLPAFAVMTLPERTLLEVVENV